MKTVGIPETVSVTGVEDSHADTANTAAIVNGDNGNKYTNNINITVYNRHSRKQKQSFEVKREFDMKTECFSRVPSVQRKGRSRVRKDSGCSLQVEYPVSHGVRDTKKFKNEVATEREAKPEANRPTETDCEDVQEDEGIGINIREGHFSDPRTFGVEMRSNGDPKGSKSSSIGHPSKRLPSRASSVEEDWEFVDHPGVMVEDNSCLNTVGNTSTEANEPRTYSVTSDDDFPDISLKDFTDGNLPPFLKDVMPSDTGWSYSSSSPSDGASKPFDPGDTKHLLEEETAGVTGTEYALWGGRADGIVDEKMVIYKQRRNSTISKIDQGLQCITSRVDVNRMKHTAENIVYILRHYPMKLVELSRKLEQVMDEARLLETTGAESEIRKTEISTDAAFGIKLMDELYEIDKEGVRHEAEQLIDDVMCLGGIEKDKLREFASFVKDLKLALI